MTADTTFGGLSDAAWDELAGKHFYSTSKWLKFCTAETGTPGSAALSSVGDGTAWAVPLRELGGLPLWSRYRWNDRLSEFGLPLLAPTGTLVGPPEGFQTHFLSTAGDRSTSGLASLIAELRGQRQFDDASNFGSCVAMYITSEDVRALRAAGVRAEPVLLDADAWIPVPEGGWSAWLESLSRNRRKSIRKEDHEFQSAGFRVVHMPLADCWERLGTAAAGTLLKYGHHTTADIELVSLNRVVEYLGDAARVALCYLGTASDPVGFCIYYHWGDTIFARWVGFNYDRLLGAAEYFNLCYYTHLKRAEESGVRWIHAGATAHEAKALRGAELRPVWLMDLTENSTLGDSTKLVRLHNARLYKQFADDPRTNSALVPVDAWKEFC